MICVNITTQVISPDGSVVGYSKMSSSVPSGPNMTAIMLPDIAVADAMLWHVGCLDCPKQPLYVSAHLYRTINVWGIGWDGGVWFFLIICARYVGRTCYISIKCCCCCCLLLIMCLFGTKMDHLPWISQTVSVCHKHVSSCPIIEIILLKFLEFLSV